MAKTQNTFHFPDGSRRNWIDTSYCDAHFSVGEKIIIEDEPQIFVVVAIQNQFRRMEHDAGQALRMIMRNVILEELKNDSTEGSAGTDFHFVFPETGQPSILHNRLLDAPLPTLTECKSKFVERFGADWADISSHEPAFMNLASGEIVAIRPV